MMQPRFAIEEHATEAMPTPRPRVQVLLVLLSALEPGVVDWAHVRRAAATAAPAGNLVNGKEACGAGAGAAAEVDFSRGSLEDGQENAR